MGGGGHGGGQGGGSYGAGQGGGGYGGMYLIGSGFKWEFELTSIWLSIFTG